MAEPRLSAWRMAAFCLPAIPIAALGLPLVVHIPNFYASEVGVSASLVGLVLMTLKFWDVFTDPVLGVMSDRYHTRWGRRRHWIVISVPIVVISTGLVFMPLPGANALYLGLSLFALYIGWTLLTLSHMSWGAELSPDYHERSRIQGWREAALLIGSIGVLALPALMELTMEDVSRRAVVRAMGLFVIILLPIGVAMAVSSVGERPAKEPHSFNWREIWAVIRDHKSLRYVLAADLCQATAMGTTAALYFWFVPIVLKLGAWSNILLLIYFVSGFVGIPLWMKISYRFGKHKTFAYGMVYSVATLPFLLFMPKGVFWIAAIGFFLYGTASGVASFLLRAIMADVTDHDTAETGHEKTGLYFSLMTMTNKVGYALSVGFALPLMDLFGVHADADGNYTDAAVNAVMLLYVVPPVILFALAGWVIWHFPLDQTRQEHLRARIAENGRVAAAKAGE